MSLNEEINQYRTLPQDLTQKDYRTALMYRNKNNFTNILATEETRVKLAHVPYINANFIFDDYIATQQPNSRTLRDFWFMIYSCKCQMIINLSGNNEYLPTSDVFVIYQSPDVEIRKIIVRDHCLYHLTFRAWPDFGIPDTSRFLQFYNIYRRLKMEGIKYGGRIVVHCRAGVGRTGTFILIDQIINLAAHGTEQSTIEVLETMRKQRSHMVQTKSQFKFSTVIIKLFDHIKEPKESEKVVHDDMSWKKTNRKNSRTEKLHGGSKLSVSCHY